MNKNKRLIGILIAVPVLLLLRYVTTFFTDEGEWAVSDFLIGGAVLLVLGLLIEWILRVTKRHPKMRWLVFALLLALLLLWAELAVGIFGTPLAGD